MSLKIFYRQSEQMLKTSTWSHVPFILSSLDYWLEVNKKLFTLCRLVLSPEGHLGVGPRALIVLLTEVGSPAHCGWHRSLDGVLDCITV